MHRDSSRRKRQLELLSSAKARERKICLQLIRTAFSLVERDFKAVLLFHPTRLGSRAPECMYYLLSTVTTSPSITLMVNGTTLTPLFFTVREIK